MVLLTLFLRFSLIVFLIVRGASEEEPEIKQATKKKVFFVNEKKIMNDVKLGDVLYEKQKAMTIKEGDSKWCITKSDDESKVALSDTYLSGKRKRTPEKTRPFSLNSAATSEEINIEKLMRKGGNGYIALESCCPNQLKTANRLSEFFDLSEEDMLRVCEKPEKSMDFGDSTDGQIFQIATENIDLHYNADSELETVSNRRPEECFLMGEDSSIKFLNHSSSPFNEKLETNPPYKAREDFENFQKDDEYVFKADKSSCCKDTVDTKYLREERNACYTRTCEDSQAFPNYSDCSEHFNPYNFLTSHKLVSSGVVPGRSILSASLVKTFSGDDKSFFLEGEEVSLGKTDSEVSQQLRGSFSYYTNNYDPVNKSSHDIENGKTFFTKEHNYTQASSAEHKIIPIQDLVEEDSSFLKNKGSEFISKNVKQLSLGEIKREIENAVKELKETGRIQSQSLDFFKNYEVYVYYTAELCSFFSEWEFFGKNYKSNVYKMNELTFKDVETSTKQFLEFVKTSLEFSCFRESCRLSDLPHSIFYSIYSIDHLVNDKDLKLGIKFTFFEQGCYKSFPGRLYFLENFSDEFEGIEMVQNSINANGINSLHFLDKAESDYLRFIYQNLKNIRAIWSLPDDDKVPLLAQKTKTLIEYHFQLFFRDNIELKMVLLPEIISMRLCIPQNRYVVRFRSIKHHLLILYSLSCLNSFFSSLEKLGLDEFFGDLDDNDSRRRIALCVFFLRKFFMTTLIQGLEIDPGVFWKYMHFLTIEFLFLINDEGCHVSRDGSKFNPMNVIFFTFFQFAGGSAKGHNLTAERLLTMCCINKGLSTAGESFLRSHYSKIKENLQIALEFIKKTGIRAADHPLEVMNGPISNFKAHSKYLNKLKLEIIQRKEAQGKKSDR